MTTALLLQLAPYIISAITGAIAIWQNRKKTRAEKVRDTLILGIEHAASLPQMRQTEKVIKGAIYARAILDGVQPLLQPVVEQLTEGALDEAETRKRQHVEDHLASSDGDAGADRP